MGYMCKYLGKDSVHPDSQVFKHPVGRYWGVWHRDKLLKSPEEVELTEENYCRIRRAIYKKREVKKRSKRSNNGSKKGSTSGSKKGSKLRSKEDFNRTRRKQLGRPGIKEFMREEEVKKLVDYYDPIPF